MSVLFMILCVNIIIFVIFFIVNWAIDHTTPDNSQWISFKAFYNFYNINKKSWELYNGFVAYRTLDNISSSHFYKIDLYKFNLIDFYKYKIFKMRIDKNKEQAESMEQYSRLISSVKEDIKKFEENNAAEMRDKLQKLII